MIRIQKEGRYLFDGQLTYSAPEPPDKARENTIAYQVLRAHNHSDNPKQMRIKADALISQDLTYVGIIQTARKSGMTRFPVPYALTNCHNSLCAVGGTINADDHVFGMTAARKYGGIYVPANLAVMHAYAREELSACGNIIKRRVCHPSGKQTPSPKRITKPMAVRRISSGWRRKIPPITTLSFSSISTRRNR